MTTYKKIVKILIILAILVSTFILLKVDAGAQDLIVSDVSNQIQTDKIIFSYDAKDNKIDKKDVKTMPVKKTNFKHTLFKFFKAMLGVLFSVLFILFGLKIYKKISFKYDEKIENIDYDKILETPKNLKEAINLFLHKTDK